MDLGKQFYTVAEIAKRWSCSPDKVSRVFRGRPGVMDLATASNAANGKRSYSILRIPAAVLRAAEEEMMRSCASRSNWNSGGLLTQSPNPSSAGGPVTRAQRRQPHSYPNLK
jgi:hypothetical protein